MLSCAFDLDHALVAQLANNTIQFLVLVTSRNISKRILTK